MIEDVRRYTPEGWMTPYWYSFIKARYELSKLIGKHADNIVTITTGNLNYFSESYLLGCDPISKLSWFSHRRGFGTHTYVTEAIANMITGRTTVHLESSGKPPKELHGPLAAPYIISSMYDLDAHIHWLKTSAERAMI